MSIRKIKRKHKLQKKKKAEKDIKDRVMSFDRMPECCVMCFKDFDKKSKEHHDTWTIVERREEKRVSLFCPDCWENGLAAVKEVVVKEQGAVDKHFSDKVSPKEFEERLKPTHRTVEDYTNVSTPQVVEEEE